MSTYYTIINSDGEVVSILRVSESDLASNTPANCTAMEGQPPDSNVYYESGNWVPKPSRPALYYEWNATTKEWYDPRTLADAKAAKREVINSWRLTANYSGFTFQGKVIATDQLSMLDITNTANKVVSGNALPANWPGGWKAKDNTYVSIATVADWNSFYDAMYQQGLANFVTAQTLKATVDAATTIAAVEAVVWPI